MPALVSASRPRHASSGDDQTEASPNGQSSPSSWSPRTILAAADRQGQGQGQEGRNGAGSPEPVAAANSRCDEEQGVTTTATSTTKALPRRPFSGVSGWETVKASTERAGGTVAAAAAASVGGRGSRPSSPLSQAGQPEIVRGGVGKNAMWSKEQQAMAGGRPQSDMKGVMLPEVETKGVVVEMDVEEEEEEEEEEEVESVGVRNLGAGDISGDGEEGRQRERHEEWESSAAEAEWDSEREHDNTVRPREPDRQDDDVSDLQWMSEARLFTGRVLPGSQRRPYEPRVFAHQEIPRRFPSASVKREALESAASSGCATEDEGSRHDSGGDGRGGGKGGVGGVSQRRNKQKRGKHRNKANNDHKKRRKSVEKKKGGGGGGDGYGLNGGLSLAKLTPMDESPSENSAPGGGSFKDANALSSSTPLPSTDSGNDDTDATGTDADADADADADVGAPAAAANNGPVGAEIRGSMRPPACGKTAPTTPRRASRRAGGGGRTAGRHGREPTSPVLFTYVTHERPSVAEEDARAGADGGGVADSSSLRRFKRRRPPRLQGGSARAVVWGEQCPACRRREFHDGDVLEGEESVAASARANCDSCVGARGDGGAGGGPVRPGQYVYLRAAASEGVRRSLVSEGEFAAPRPGGLYGSDLAGARIRVWRESGASVGGSGGSGDAGGNKGGGGGGGGGSYAEADVVQFNPVAGKHRLRFVEDGAVEDVSLMKPIENGGDRGGEGGGGVRWLQRRTRARARDVVQRNAAGLCEGPAGEARGLIGDEHDPAAQRQENWRWAMSRWRWDLGERDGYGGGGRARDKGVGGGGTSEARVDGDRNVREHAGVPLAGDGMFPPIGRVLALERRYVGTGKKVVDANGGSGRAGDGEAGEPVEVFLKVKRLWYPQDTLRGMDPFVHGKAEVFEACQVVNGSPNVRAGGRVDGAPAAGDVDACLCASSDGSYSTQYAAAGNGDGGRSLEASACTRRVDAKVDGGASVAPACRLDAGQRLKVHPKLEPVILWVRACEAQRLASVHPCLDGRLNPCSGKVVNDPHQPQAEFFLSHRYCLELDAYFPLVEEGRSPCGSSNSCAGGGTGDTCPLSPRTGEDGGRNLSPRSTKARLLNRGVSDGVLDLPAKWHPLKKRISLDQATTAAGNGGGGGGRDSPVIGWESAVGGRSGWSESTRGNAGVTTVSVSASPGRSDPAGHGLDDLFLCHRCRHALPSRRLQRCRGRGCDNHFCAPCVAGRSWSGCGGRGSPRGARWPASREAFGKGGKYCKGTDDGDGGRTTGCETPKPWTGPCCHGQCGCWECIAGEGEGLLFSWRARNGLPCMATVVAQQPTREVRPAQLRKTSTPKKAIAAFEWSGWQGRPKVASVVSVGRADCNGSSAVENGTKPGARDAATVAVGSAAKAAACDGVESESRARASEDDLDVGIEWCRSCSGPSPTGSLTRCYYCNDGVHASRCRRFEEMLTSQRLAEYGVGSSGQIVSLPTREGAVGHGVAVCVRRRWRAGLVLCWSPTLRAHYVRYVDGAPEQGAAADTDLDAIPWDGEWVVLPAPSAEAMLRDGKAAAAAVGAVAVAAAAAADRSADYHRFATAVPASAVRWPLVEVVLRLHPVPSPPSSGSVPTITSANSVSGLSSSAPPLSSPHPPPSRPPPAPESRPATKVLKGLLKQTWLASQAAAASTEGGPRKNAGGSQKYRPPAVALPSTISEPHGGDGGGNEPTKTGTRPWVCRRCVESKLKRLQRRVRSQFQGTQEIERSARESSVVPSTRSAAVLADQTVSSPAAPSPAVTSKFAAGWLRPQPATADAGCGSKSAAAGPCLAEGETVDHNNGISERADDRDRESLRDGRRELDGPVPKQGPVDSVGLAKGKTEGVAPPSVEAATVVDTGADATVPLPPVPVAAKDESTDREEQEKHRNELCRAAQGSRRLRWLPAGNPGSTRPFSYEAGFLSDVSGIHAHGGLTASGATVGTNRRGGSRGSRKRPRPPPVARAFSHLLAGLDAQGPLAFSLPVDVTRLDRDMASFFSGGGGADTSGGGDMDGGVGLFDEAVRGGRSVVLVDGTEAAAAAAAGRVSAKAAANWSSSMTVKREGVGGTGAGGAGGSGGAAAAAPPFVRVPSGFTSVQEVDLESSARIRPLDTSKQRKLRASGSGGGVRNASRSTLMCTREEVSASLAEDASAAGDGPAGGLTTTTLKDVSRKDRMQRMDQRRMRRQGQQLVEAGLLNLDVLQSRRKKLRFGRSPVHAWGVFADEPIAAGDLVIEYRGEIIGNAVADKREKMYEDMQIGSDYMFRVDEDTVVDATFKGSLARFINHSCDPSCTTRIIAVEGSKKIVIYAERDVGMGEELSYDYKFPLEPDEAARVPCRCGSEKCRGFIN